MFIVIAILGMVAAIASDWYSALPATATAQFVGRDTCAKCHQAELALWHGSDHDRAMELPSATSVVGDFNNTSFTRFGVTTKFFRDGEKYLVNTEGPDGEFHDYEIKYTFGVRPLQQYMVEFPDGRVQVLRVSWDTVKNEWFYVTPPDVIDERILPGDPLHWTGMGQNWNTMCAECHSTNLQKNYDPQSDTYHTTYSEIDVSCETCHGPGSMHVELAESNSLFWDRNHGYGLPELKQASSAEQVDSCAPCHSRRTQIHANFHAGDKYLDHYEPSPLHEGLYHADGQMLDEVYVYGSFLQSKMYAEKVRCTDCHNPHSLELKFEGNLLCAQCHTPGKYDTPTHHHHTDTAATQCVNCHMVEHTYMNVDGRRDHSFRIPRPDLSAKLGTPNACNGCHTKDEETSEWAAAAVRQWYGDKRLHDPHYGEVLTEARRGTPEGLKLLQTLLRRGDTSDIVRATAVELLANYSSQESNPLTRKALKSRSPLVRIAALRSLSFDFLRRTPQEVAVLLEDSFRPVRMAAAIRLAGGAAQLISAKSRLVLDKAIVEYRKSQLVMQERAAAQLNLAALAQTQGNSKAMSKSLRRAIFLEPYLLGVRDKLAALLLQTKGDPEEVRKLRVEEAAMLLRFSDLFPEWDDFRYQRAILLYQLGQYDEARQEFAAACELQPESFKNWFGLASICEYQQRWREAAKALKEMERIHPHTPEGLTLYKNIHSHLTPTPTP